MKVGTLDLRSNPVHAEVPKYPSRGNWLSGLMEILLLKAALLFYLFSTVAFLLPLLSSRALPHTLAPSLLFAAFVAHFGSITARSLAAGYIAVVDSYEALSFFACLM